MTAWHILGLLRYHICPYSTHSVIIISMHAIFVPSIYIVVLFILIIASQFYKALRNVIFKLISFNYKCNLLSYHRYVKVYKKSQLK